ncbi:nuclear transport factor 2 family protein [Nocardioides albidus]|uniref:Nuclear transport factor 2 family protein n=1 Tax=Nocardioides albidus TaxID=1517589 RepID=A0A5C4VZ61_9ACTN|nr:nuclear transport factor 2 family protein [Nocardioides albidus]TNM41151.1 nuclear transport factor 2 family protein [Nocardioides albidus]
MTIELADLLAERIDDFPVPSADLATARSAGRRLRRRRRAMVAAAGATGVAVVAAGIALTSPGGGDAGTVRDPSYASVGALDLSKGARAYADPGVTVHLGGREFPYGELEWLDTDAVATPQGVVFFDAGRPMLLDARGDVSRLVDGRLDAPNGFHPTAKLDRDGRLAAWATLRDGTATITVRDLDTGDDVGSTTVDCGRCGDLVIDAIDQGAVFVRDRAGTRTWTWEDDQWRDFAGPETRVADARAGVVLYNGPAPSNPSNPGGPGDWRPVAGAVDAQLTLDGRYVLSWSSTLTPTTPGDPPVVLPVGPAAMGDSFGWYAIDTDGSILVATGRDYPKFTVYDCEVGAPACDELGPLRPKGGDPMFIGVDM